MSLWHCTACTTAYAVGLPACPQCGGTSYTENGVPGTGTETADAPAEQALAPAAEKPIVHAEEKPAAPAKTRRRTATAGPGTPDGK